MSDEILTTIMAALSIIGFMYTQTARLSAEIKEVRADIATVNERLSHTDGLVEGLSRALLTARASQAMAGLEIVATKLL